MSLPFLAEDDGEGRLSGLLARRDRVSATSLPRSWPLAGRLWAGGSYLRTIRPVAVGVPVCTSCVLLLLLRLPPGVIVCPTVSSFEGDNLVAGDVGFLSAAVAAEERDFLESLTVSVSVHLGHWKRSAIVQTVSA